MHYCSSVRTLDLCKLSLNLSAKAWGFAGVSLGTLRRLTLNEDINYFHLVCGKC